MWKFDSKNNQWRKIITNGSLKLTFVIKETNSSFVLSVIQIKNSNYTICCVNIEQAKKLFDEHIRFTLKWG